MINFDYLFEYMIFLNICMNIIVNYLFFSYNRFIISLSALETLNYKIRNTSIRGIGFNRKSSSIISINMSNNFNDRGKQMCNYNIDIPLSTWRERIDTSIAKSRKVKGGNYVQIATVDSNGEPKCRTVVFRGFSELSYSPNAMKMITDIRSEKVEHIRRSPRCELVWWFSQSSEQYRISGNLQLITADESSQELINARKQQWNNLSDAGREQFFWLQPGEKYDGIPSVPRGGRNEEDGKILPPPDTFLLMLLHPDTVKYLRLSDNLALVDKLSLQNMKDSIANITSNNWSVSRVNP